MDEEATPNSERLSVQFHLAWVAVGLDAGAAPRGLWTGGLRAGPAARDEPKTGQVRPTAPFELASKRQEAARMQQHGGSTLPVLRAARTIGVVQELCEVLDLVIAAVKHGIEVRALLRVTSDLGAESQTKTVRRHPQHMLAVAVATVQVFHPTYHLTQ